MPSVQTRVLTHGAGSERTSVSEFHLGQVVAIEYVLVFRVAVVPLNSASEWPHGAWSRYTCHQLRTSKPDLAPPARAAPLPTPLAPHTQAPGTNQREMVAGTHAAARRLKYAHRHGLVVEVEKSCRQRPIGKLARNVRDQVMENRVSSVALVA